ncbi:hypothetical protein ASS85_10890 [Staphylococcus saprophyticus]|uniref:hypothetical protein n=1 Tax=Staphylococcus saprophyticus TaxID=29385 RepID=UPI000852A2FF|nr:hypothetical protein [Staphylococcus saprophyticus]MDW4018941.1 hypothetical protein [Staphylococcus saprophyticus]MDW4271894.1 hypothetical protein [Staphylococcus saprophyticus]OEK29693.1 hypothetical protein ASS85_10890 [Staphylococcus saprophyticus]
MNNTVKDYEKLSEQYNKMIAERNSLIDDLSWYKAKVSRLEDENEKLKRENRRKHYSANENNKYYKELWERTEEYRKEVTEITEKYSTLTDHIRLKAEMNPGVSRYLDLVNYIDRLEQE